MKSISLILLSLIFFVSCTKDKNEKYSLIPEINLTNVSSRNLSFTDTIGVFKITFTLRDGDGNIGRGNVNDSAIIFEDVRSDTVYQRIKLPYPTIPAEFFKNGQLLAITTFQVPMTALVPRFDNIHLVQLKDTFVARIRVYDDLGNESNIVESPPIYIGE